jgi:hypothetical protein
LAIAQRAPGSSRRAGESPKWEKRLGSPNLVMAETRLASMASTINGGYGIPVPARVAAAS